MGMHHGLVVFGGSIQALYEVLEERNGKLAKFGKPIRLDKLPRINDLGFPCAYKTVGEVTLFFDGSFMLGSDMDLIVALAQKTKARAAGCVGETVSGSFRFTAAEPTGVVRAYAHCHSTQSEPWTFGQALKCEASAQFDGDLDGSVFFAAFKELGFGNLQSQYKALWTPCFFTKNWDAPSPPKSKLSLECQAFCESKSLEKTPPVKVVKRQTPPA